MTKRAAYHLDKLEVGQYIEYPNDLGLIPGRNRSARLHNMDAAIRAYKRRHPNDAKVFILSKSDNGKIRLIRTE